MIFQPVVSGGGASGGSDWKEVDRSYIAEHINDRPANFLVAVFTTDFPDQPMIIPASNVFSLGSPVNGELGLCSYGLGHPTEEELFRHIYAYTTQSIVGLTESQDSPDVILDIQLNDPSGTSDTIPEGWQVKYYAYTPS